MVYIYLNIVITAFVGAIAAFLFRRIDIKIDAVERKNEQRHQQQVSIRMAERELILAMADTLTLAGKKIEDANSVNGELKEAIATTKEKEKNVQEVTRKIAIEHTT